MAKLLFLFLILLSFSACKKNCYECTRKWTYEYYVLLDSSGKHDIISYPAQTFDEPFENCSSDKPTVQYTHEYKGMNPYGPVYLDGKGECTCVPK